MSVEIVNYTMSDAERVKLNVNETEREQPERVVQEDVSIETEEIRKPSNNVLETRKGKIKQWTELSYYLPKDVDPHHKRFLKGYFRAQLKIADGQKVRAREIFDGLVKKKGYEEFEEENQALLAAIDIVVRGFTNRKPVGGPGFRAGEG